MLVCKLTLSSPVLQSSLCTGISEFIYGGMKYGQKYSVIEILISIDKMQCFKKILPVRISSITVGSKSTKSALGTCFPELVSEKKVLKESSAIPSLSSDGICPSGCIPCSITSSSHVNN